MPAVRPVRRRRRGWPSPMRQGRSSLPAFVIEVVHRSGESDPSAASTSDAIEDVVERGGAGEASQFAREVLLQRLSFRPGAPLQVCVDILWEISHQHIRHACILLSRRTQVQPPRPASIARYARFQSGFPPLPAAAVDRTNLAPHLHHSHCTCRPPTTTALPGGSQVGAPLRGGLATRALAGGAGVPSAGARFPPRPCCVSSAEPIGSMQRHGLLTLRAGWCTLPTDCSTDLE